MGFPKLRDDEKEKELMEKMVASNFEDANEPIKSPDLQRKEEGFKCDKCEFEAKSAFGLQSHQRKHK